MTIFVSTHFMNEGERCDRISLMHAGRVLATDAPAALMRARGAATLEEAFVGYLEAASGGPIPEAAMMPTPATPHHAARWFSVGRLLAYARRESLELARDPIRLTFASLQASVPHACAQWTQDAGVSDWKHDASNESLWNFGCSNQSMLAAQIADPIDLVRSRSEGRADIVKRMGAIGKLREGKDPSTQYRQETPQINSAVGGR